MRIFRRVTAMSTWSGALRREGVSIGLVPTMGALHAGHRAIIRAARLTCDAVVVSLFVNPRQFGPGEDFARYPRRLRQDAALCRREGVDALFAPGQREIYPTGFQTSVVQDELYRRWEGAARPGHFEGVATVVVKLLNIVRPDAAFFGQKDFQQTVVIRRLTEDLNLGVRVIVCPTVRDPDGVALSSRNEYLSAKQRRTAAVLYRALKAGAASIQQGERSAAQVRRVMLAVARREPLARVDYLVACDPRTLEPLVQIVRPAVLLGAIRIGRVRLIDNILIDS